jgi:hypothetical protein
VDWRGRLSPGERATVMVIASDRRQARVILRYVKAFLSDVPMLRRLVENETAESVDLTNRVSIEVNTASHRRTRGYAIAAALCDEIAFWKTDETAADPDREVLDAIRPGMAQFENSVLICASSPYARRGELFDAHERHFAKDGDPVTVWQAPTTRMNPTISEAFIEQEEKRRGRAFVEAEYLAMFRQAVRAFLDRRMIEACTPDGVTEREPERRQEYVAFVDSSGGRKDSMTLAIACTEGTTRLLCKVIEKKPPFNPQAVVAEFADVLRQYRCHEVTGDGYGAEWVSQAFEDAGIYYRTSKLNRTEIYLALEPLIYSRKVELLDEPGLIEQLAALERSTGSRGRDSIDHPRDGHDDIANAAAGALVLAPARGNEWLMPVRKPEVSDPLALFR